MTIQRFLIVLMKWLAAFALATGIVMLIRLFCIESYRISTDSMEEALHKGDYILVNKIPGKNKPVRGKVVLFTSPLSRDSADAPLFISRCIGMPGDTIRVSMDGYTINGQKIPPFSPLPLFLFHNTERQGDVLGDVREVGHPT